MLDKLDELRRKAEEAARDINEKYEIKSKLDKGARAASEAVRKGAEVASAGFDAAREEATRLNREHKVTETVAGAARSANNCSPAKGRRGEVGRNRRTLAGCMQICAMDSR